MKSETYDISRILSLIAIIVASVTFDLHSSIAADAPKRPRIVGDWWQVAGDPELGDLTSPKQQPVDFAIWQAADGTWQLWSCILGGVSLGGVILGGVILGGVSP
jgi:hypothetical protein